jgi:M6 family metalloprotease-like protein
MSYPFYGEEFTFIQPDGSELKVRGWGDQHYAVFETVDGYTVVKNPATGFYEYADVTPDADDYRPSGIAAGAADPGRVGLTRRMRISRLSARAKAMDAYQLMGVKRRCEERRERQKARLRAAFAAAGPVLAPPSRTMSGSYVGLCLLIQFSDVPGTISRQEVDDFCNKPGYQGFGNNGSVYDYFVDNSNGHLHYTNIVTEYYTTEHPRSYYTNPAIPQGQRAREMILEALKDLEARGFDFTQLSADDEGYVYAINVFYAGRRVNSWGEGLWPHSWSLARRHELAPGRWAYDYQITDMTSELTLATFCHENGHMVCDYPDLYDYGYESQGSGGYCLMAFGGPNKKNPVQIGAYLKYKSGWASQVATIGSDIQVDLSAGGNQFLKLAKNRTEYFLVENRHKAGRDSHLPSSGLAVWHVDELASNNDEDMTHAKHYECALEQADGNYDLEHGTNSGDMNDLFNAATNAEFSDVTEPSSRWWDGTASKLRLHDIGHPGEVIGFRAGLYEGGDGGGDSEIITLQQSLAPDLVIPDADPTGVRSVIHFDKAAQITAVKVSLDITHTYRGDLQVTLLAPSGDSVTLHKKGTGGGADHLRADYDVGSLPELSALVGQSPEGDWTLHVQDLVARDNGTLNTWALEVQGTISDGGTDRSVIELGEEPGERIPDNDPQGITRSLSTDETGLLRDIAVDVDISHSYVSDLIVTLVSPTGRAVDLHRLFGGSSDDVVKTYDATTTPGLTDFFNESVNGSWQLHVSDHARRDIGKLNRWALRLVQQL